MLESVSINALLLSANALPMRQTNMARTYHVLKLGMNRRMAVLAAENLFA
jgi:hypothetical protein